jgi:hypothetical protein
MLGHLKSAGHGRTDTASFHLYVGSKKVDLTEIERWLPERGDWGEMAAKGYKVSVKEEKQVLCPITSDGDYR